VIDRRAKGFRSSALVAAVAIAGAGAAVAWIAVAPLPPASPGLAAPPAPVEPAAAAPQVAQPVLEPAPPDAPTLRQETEAPAAAAVPAGSARERAAALAASIDPCAFDPVAFDVQARAIAGAAGESGLKEIRRLAGDAGLTPGQRIAAAEILRHAPVETDREPVLPAATIAELRLAWQGRADDPVRAAASVRSLAAFGDAEDRRMLLDAVSLPASASTVSLARTGLSGARGDAAAIELTRAAVDRSDARRAEVALCALTTLASSRDRALSPAGRAECAASLRSAMEEENRGGRSPRLAAALAAVDPESARAALAASPCGPRADEERILAKQLAMKRKALAGGAKIHAYDPNAPVRNAGTGAGTGATPTPAAAVAPGLTSATRPPAGDR
jgi:hypothetical protein